MSDYRRLQMNRSPTSITPKKKKIEISHGNDFSARKIKISTIEICMEEESFPLLQNPTRKKSNENQKSAQKNEIPPRSPIHFDTRKVEKDHGFATHS